MGLSVDDYLKFSQFSSYVDQIRAGVKYFVELRGKKAVCVTYQDTDFGKDPVPNGQVRERHEF